MRDGLRSRANGSRAPQGRVSSARGGAWAWDMHRREHHEVTAVGVLVLHRTLHHSPRCHASCLLAPSFSLPLSLSLFLSLSLSRSLSRSLSLSLITLWRGPAFHCFLTHLVSTRRR